MSNQGSGRVRKSPYARKMIVAFICVFVAAFAVGTPGALCAHADSADVGNINLEYQWQGVNVEGASVELYRVADWKTDGTFALVDTFSDVRYDWDALMRQFASNVHDGKTYADEFQTAANTLDAYAHAEKLRPSRTGTVGVSGVSFPGLTKGLYLVVFDRFADTEKTCESSASLIALPTNENGKLVSTVTAHSKGDCVATPKTTKTATINASKVWRKDNDRNRPESIEVQLLKNGVVVDTAKLTADGDWKRSWTGLDASCDWRVVEKSVPKGYTVAIDRNGADYTIFNTRTRIAETGVNTRTIALAAIVAVLVAAAFSVAIRVNRRRSNR